MGTMEQEVVQAMPRLLSKVHTGSVSILDRFPLDKLSPHLTLIGRILNQFDQTMFNILMFSTNFALLTRNFLTDNADPFVIFYPLENPSDENPITADPITYQHLKAAFGDATDLSFEEFEQIMNFSANRLQLQLFCQAFSAVWLRDYGESVEISPAGLVNHLRSLFAYEKMDERERAQVDQIALRQSTRCVRHVLVTFTHMASKDYERITRSG